MPSRQELENWAAAAARRYEIPPGGYILLIGRESSWDPDAVSPAGAMGLAQLMPRTATELGVVDPFDPQEALDAGARYLDMTRSRVRGVAPNLSGPALWAAILASYNWGIGAWTEAWDQYGDAWICVSPEETERYVDALTEPFSGYSYVVACGSSNPPVYWPAVALLLALVAVA